MLNNQYAACPLHINSKLATTPLSLCFLLRIWCDVLSGGFLCKHVEMMFSLVPGVAAHAFSVLCRVFNK